VRRYVRSARRRLLLLGRAGRPPLFPYTTLFRSEALRHHGVAAVNHAERGVAVGHAVDRDAKGHDVRQLLEADVLALHLAPDRERDRKSTRLNSSHVKTSYAVFCLKKKKRHRTRC